MIGLDALLAAEFARSRPGLHLVSIESAALPMAWLSVEVLAQERKPLPLLDEFVLRLAAEGVDTVPTLSQVLGISEQMVADSVADQLFLNRLVRTNMDGGLLKLTAVGTELARDMAAVLPREEVLGYGFDLMMKRVTAFPRGILVTATQANQNGLRRLPQGTNLVGEGDLTAAHLNQLLREGMHSRSEIEILDCRRILQQAKLFLPVKLLVFADAAAVEVQIGFVIEGEVSRKHELQLSQMGGAKSLEIEVSPPAIAVTLDPELELQRIPGEIVEDLWRNSVMLDSGSQDQSHQREGPDTEIDPTDLDLAQVRAVAAFEFADLLVEACMTGRRRILIVSRVVHLVALDASLVDSLEQRLRVGVIIHIGYQDAILGTKTSTTRRLFALAKRYPDSFHIGRVALPFVEQLLLWDDVLVCGTYSWLSARGDLGRPRRSEDGTLIRRADHIDAVYSHRVAELEGSVS